MPKTISAWLKERPSSLALEMLEDELTDLLWCDFTRVDDTTIWIDFPSGYRIVAMCEVLNPKSGLLPNRHRVEGKSFEQLFAEEGADVIYFVIGQGDTGPPAAYASDVIAEVHIDVDPSDDGEFFYDFPRWPRKEDPYKEFVSQIIRAAAFRTVNAWQPLNGRTIERGVGVSPGAPKSMLYAHLSKRGDGYGKWKKLWRVTNRIADNRHRTLELLTEDARKAVKARGKLFAEKHSTGKPPMTAEEHLRRQIQLFANKPAPQSHETALERSREKGIMLSRMKLAAVDQEAARRYRERFWCDPRRKLNDDDEPGEFAYANGDGLDILDEAIKSIGLRGL